MQHSQRQHLFILMKPRGGSSFFWCWSTTLIMRETGYFSPGAPCTFGETKGLNKICICPRTLLFCLMATLHLCFRSRGESSRWGVRLSSGRKQERASEWCNLALFWALGPILWRAKVSWAADNSICSIFWHKLKSVMSFSVPHLRPSVSTH